MNKIYLIILTWITLISTASATGQEGERIIWKGQKYEMLTLPSSATSLITWAEKWKEKRQ